MQEDQPLASSRERQDTVVPIGRSSFIETSPKICHQIGKSLELPQVKNGLFGSNIKNIGDSQLARQDSKETRPVLKKM